MYLFYSAIYGLNELDKLPVSIAPNSYMRNKFGTWNRLVRRQQTFAWIQVNKCDLPKELRLEALILNITL